MDASIFAVSVVDAIEALREYPEAHVSARSRIRAQRGQPVGYYVYKASAPGFCRLGVSNWTHERLLKTLDEIYSDLVPGGHVFFQELLWHAASSQTVAQACMRKLERVGLPYGIEGLRRPIADDLFDELCQHELRHLEAQAAKDSARDRAAQALNRLQQLDG